jgi:hypothetical protein
MKGHDGLKTRFELNAVVDAPNAFCYAASKQLF